MDNTPWKRPIVWMAGAAIAVHDITDPGLHREAEMPRDTALEVVQPRALVSLSTANRFLPGATVALSTGTVSLTP